MLVEAIKELKAENNSLKIKVTELELRLKAIEEKLSSFDFCQKVVNEAGIMMARLEALWGIRKT